MLHDDKSLCVRCSIGGEGSVGHNGKTIRTAVVVPWPCIESMPKSEAEYTCAVGTGAKAKEACNEEESIYGRSPKLLSGQADARKCR
ncbi:hypothetical protein D3C78_1393310 [compost metagenome]